MTDTEFASWLRSLPREKSPEQVEQAEHQHDAERGPYVPRSEITYHCGEAAH